MYNITSKQWTDIDNHLDDNIVIHINSKQRRHFLLQMSGWAGAQNLHAESGKAIQYSGMTDCFRRTVQEEGYRALFKVPPHIPPPPHSLPLHVPLCPHTDCYTTFVFCCLEGLLVDLSYQLHVDVLTVLYQALKAETPVGHLPCCLPAPPPALQQMLPFCKASSFPHPYPKPHLQALLQVLPLAQ